MEGDEVKVEELLEQTRLRFPEAGNELSMDPIVRGGSERTFTRVRSANGWAAVVVVDSGAKVENGLYGDIARFLAGLGVAVPRILGEDRGARLLWMEDLGGEDLHAFQHRPWAERRAAYAGALEAVGRLHREGPAGLNRTPLPLMVGFAHGTYAWEREYFLHEFLGGACGLDREGVVGRMAEKALLEVAELLQRHPETLLHRDFQSQNVMVWEGRAHLIDFQGMRFGPAPYDVGSLLYDPYVTFTHVERMELLEIYREVGAPRGEQGAGLEHRFYLGAAQRLCQALGAYGFLGLKRGKAEFLQYIPAGLRHLRDAARRSEVLPGLLEAGGGAAVEALAGGQAPASRFGLSV
ncbi:MAG: phosphotransferase [Verrucomicrobiia bacterium]